MKPSDRILQIANELSARDGDDVRRIENVITGIIDYLDEQHNQ